MSVKYWLVRKYRKLLGTKELIDNRSSSDLQILPGTPYQKYFLPLEYLPSQDYKPRWGYRRPRHSGLEKQFATNVNSYRKVIEELRTLKPFLQSIKKDFTHQAAPEPGWFGGPMNPLDLALVYYFVMKYQPRT